MTISVSAMWNCLKQSEKKKTLYHLAIFLEEKAKQSYDLFFSS